MTERRPPTGVRVRKVIETIYVMGDGTPEDPVREVRAYYALGGALLATRDVKDLKLNIRVGNRP